MSLDQCMREHTERQRDLRLAWLEEEWNHPSLTDHYLMRVCREVARKFADKPGEIQDEGFRIRFLTALSPKEEPDDKEKERVAEEHRRNVSAIARQSWQMRIEQGVKQHQAALAKKGGKRP